MAAPRFSILTPVYETPAGRPAQDAALGQPPELRRLGAVPGRRRLQGSRTCARSSTRRQPTTRASASPTASRTAASSPPPTTPWRWPTGEFVGLLDHDDLLHPDALARRRRGDRRQPRGRLRLHRRGQDRRRGRHSSPFFKPDWSPERMRTQMYTCHFSVLRRSLVEEVGGFDAEFEGSQDWDLVLKVTERARRVVHVPRILYHWRMLDDLDRRGRRGREALGLRSRRRGRSRPTATGSACRRRSSWTPPTPASSTSSRELTEQPLVSIVIPTAGQIREVRFEPTVLVAQLRPQHRRALDLRELRDRRRRRRRHCPPEILRRAEGARRRAAADRPRSTPARSTSRRRSTSAPCAARGEHLLLLNDDIEVTTPNWIERMVMYSSARRVGAVGGRLLWGDGRLQHVGVDFDGGLPGHTYRGFPGDFNGYANAVLIARNCLAVTGACLMTRARRLRGARRPHRWTCRSTSTTSTTASRCTPPGAASSTTPTSSSSTSSPPAATRWSTTGSQYKLVDRWGPVIAGRPLRQPERAAGAAAARRPRRLGQTPPAEPPAAGLSARRPASPAAPEPGRSRRRRAARSRRREGRDDYGQRRVGGARRRIQRRGVERQAERREEQRPTDREAGEDRAQAGDRPGRSRASAARSCRRG